MRGETLASKQMRVNKAGFMTAAEANAISGLDWPPDSSYQIGAAVIFI